MIDFHTARFRRMIAAGMFDELREEAWIATEDARMEAMTDDEREAERIANEANYQAMLAAGYAPLW